MAEKEEGIRLAIVGSRDYAYYQAFEVRVEQWIAIYGRPELIISGGAQGIDRLARRYAQEQGILLEEFPYESKLGKAGGPARNTKIVAAATHVLAFPSRFGRGTQDTISKAQHAGLPLTLHYTQDL